MKRGMQQMLLVSSFGLLAGCGSQADTAATACEAAVAERLQGGTYSIDLAALAASAEEQPDDVVHLKSGIVFEPGLPGEYRQQVECRVRFGDVPDVISLTFYY